MKKILAAFIWSFCSLGFSQTDFYHPGSIQQIEVFFSQPDWNRQLNILKMTTGGYLKADSVKINGTNLPNVGVKYKGNSSYDSSRAKNPIHIELNHYQSQNYQGFQDIKLSNCYQDPSMIREVLSYQILGHYMICPKANFAQVYVNGNLLGLYTNVEDVNKTFCSNRFQSARSNTFIKCSPVVTPGPNARSNLRYLGPDSLAYFNFYELKSSTGWNQLINLCQAANSNPGMLPQMLDMDRLIWMLAFDNVLVNLDSYIGAFSQNHFLYKDNLGLFNSIVWDLNMSFGGFPFLGAGASSLAALTIANMKQMPVNVHESDPFWPLIQVVMNNARFRKIYAAHVKTITKEMFETGLYETMAQEWMQRIDEAVQQDANKFFSYQQFQRSLETDISVGNYQVPGIKSLMAARSTYLLATPALSAEAPVLTEVGAGYSFQTWKAHVTARISNHSDTAVYVGYRINPYTRMQRLRMFDDGLHQDGKAGDGVYGAIFDAEYSNTTFYIYAENAQAAAFSPGRAEHEMYKIDQFVSTSPTLTASQLTIYPNPVKGHFYLQSAANQQVAFQLFDFMGKPIMQGIATQKAIDISHLKPGIYRVVSGRFLGKLCVEE